MHWSYCSLALSHWNIPWNNAYGYLYALFCTGYSNSKLLEALNVLCNHVLFMVVFLTRFPQCQQSNPEKQGYNQPAWIITKHTKAWIVCVILGIYCDTKYAVAGRLSDCHVANTHQDYGKYLHAGWGSDQHDENSGAAKAVILIIIF